MGLVTNVDQIKASLVPCGSYRHNKTGNLYTHYGLVQPTASLQLEQVSLSFHAHCCENKDVLVEVYYTPSGLYYVPNHQPLLYENDKPKVLYERNGVFWLRSVDDFEVLVELNGQRVPRFQRVD